MSLPTKSSAKGSIRRHITTLQQLTLFTYLGLLLLLSEAQIQVFRLQLTPCIEPLMFSFIFCE